MLLINQGFPIHGVILDVNDMIAVKNFYDIAATQEFLVENYRISELEAELLAQAVLEKMDKSEHQMTEQEALLSLSAISKPLQKS